MGPGPFILSRVVAPPTLPGIHGPKPPSCICPGCFDRYGFADPFFCSAFPGIADSFTLFYMFTRNLITLNIEYEAGITNIYAIGCVNIRNTMSKSLIAILCLTVLAGAGPTILYCLTET